ncbi:Eco57I restriction-modification methylase domain-containing protein [Lapidilactobacillus salsurivasis]
MTSNFEFLNQDSDTQAFYKLAEEAEEHYLNAFFAAEFVAIRKIGEQVVRDYLDLYYVNVPSMASFNDCLTLLRGRTQAPRDIIDKLYGIKRFGNSAAHTITHVSKADGLQALRNVRDILLWFASYLQGSDVNVSEFQEPKNKLYQTSERKLIYVQSPEDNKNLWPAYTGLEKVGDASVDDFEEDSRPNSDYLRSEADKRVRQYMNTAGVPYKIWWAELAYRKKDHSWFRDYDVHDVLERSGVKHTEITTGNEWFKTDVETVKAAIKAVKEGRQSINAVKNNSEVVIRLRPEQQEAVKQTREVLKKHNEMLWNAKMRFGKTLTALQLIKEEHFAHVLIMTHRPVVNDGWFEDFNKIGLNSLGYVYGSKSKGETLETLSKQTSPFVYFASIQDLRESAVFGGKYPKNELITKIDWNLVIIDEAHEGTQTDLAQKVIDSVVKEQTKLLELSGTPFNLLDQYDEDQVYTWDYVMEQNAKKIWSQNHPNEVNPYEGLPKVSMYTFEMKKSFQDANFLDIDHQSFNFKEFFRVEENGSFTHESKVKQFLDNITNSDQRTNYPYSTELFRSRLRHTLWVLPGIKEACALERLLKQHPIFGKEYQIINIVDHDTREEVEASENDVHRVLAAITKNPMATKTITLTVRKLTTGVTIKPWTGVLFLANTNSAMQYLQAAFRAQTPYQEEHFGRKTNCYIFDFAPDRALRVMAESAQMNTGVGKLISGARKNAMGRLLNFLPIIGETGQGMQEYQVDSLLTKLKRVYAEKAVRTGFDDDSIYSDELLKLDKQDLNDFNDLKALVGSTPSEKKKIKIPVNEQGLSNEEYEQAENAKNKKPRERTLEEQEALEKLKQQKKQRRVMISILRAISIRIPLMIYGMDIDLEQDVSFIDFAKRVDDKSWAEFMPKGVTKEKFRRFAKYYDGEVFIEAGRIIRRRVKELDTLDPIDRVEKIAALMGTFKNPDKETVLTPWRVVNLHLGKTIGGLSFFDSDYSDSTRNGLSTQSWVTTDITDRAFDPDSRILEINSKTGLYPLYAAASLYWRAFERMNEERAGKFDFEDELNLWQDILKNNVYVLAKTPMAKTITEKTLSGYRSTKMNIAYLDNIVEDSKNNLSGVVQQIQERMNLMKFDVVIGNPPYQEAAKGESTRSEPIYYLFMELGYKLATIATFITPARFLFQVGQTPKSWNTKMLKDDYFEVTYYEEDSSKVFPNNDIKGGVVVTLRDSSIRKKSIGVFARNNELKSILPKIDSGGRKPNMDSLVSSRGMYRFTTEFFDDIPNASKKLGRGTGNMIVSNALQKFPKVFEDVSGHYPQYKVLGRLNSTRVYKYIDQRYVQDTDYTDCYKVVVPKANGSGKFGERLAEPVIEGPQEISTDSFISVGKFEKESEAKSLLKYIKTRFLRTLLGTYKVTQDSSRFVWGMVPLQDFTSNSDIDWSKSVAEIDQQLYRKYGLNQHEIDFIETKVKAMD